MAAAWERVDQCSGQSISGEACTAADEAESVPATGSDAPFAIAVQRSQRTTPLKTHMMHMKVPQSLHG